MVDDVIASRQFGLNNENPSHPFLPGKGCRRMTFTLSNENPTKVSCWFGFWFAAREPNNGD